MARTFGIVFWVSQSLVSFLNFVGAGREGPLRAMIPSRLTNVSSTLRREYLVPVSPAIEAPVSSDCPEVTALGDIYKTSTLHVGQLSDAFPLGMRPAGWDDRDGPLPRPH